MLVVLLDDYTQLVELAVSRGLVSDGEMLDQVEDEDAVGSDSKSPIYGRFAAGGLPDQEYTESEMNSLPSKKK